MLPCNARSFFPVGRVRETTCEIFPHFYISTRLFLHILVATASPCMVRHFARPCLPRCLCALVHWTFFCTPHVLLLIHVLARHVLCADPRTACFLYIPVHGTHTSPTVAAVSDGRERGVTDDGRPPYSTKRG